MSRYLPSLEQWSPYPVGKVESPKEYKKPDPYEKYPCGNNFEELKKTYEENNQFRVQHWYERK